MSALLYLAGLVIGITIFLYIVSTVNTAKDKIEARKKPVQDPSIKPESISLKDKILSAPPGARICPLCGSSLTKYEALYASQVKAESGTKILIYGCRYCYRPDEDPDEVKRSNISG